MKQLRQECAWDKKQTNQSLLPYLLEESYELIYAIQSGDIKDIKAELGDVLLQVVFHAQLYDEQGQFAIGDVIYGLMDKLIRRHPYVFDKENLATEDDVKRRWQQIKALENQHKPNRSLVQHHQGTALMQAHSIQQQAYDVGFDWSDVGGAWAKFCEEVGELQAILPSEPVDSNLPTDQLADELGDCFFALVNVARKLGLDSEMVLIGAINKFQSRLGFVEDELAKTGKTLQSATLDEMDMLWQMAKTQ